MILAPVTMARRMNPLRSRWAQVRDLWELRKMPFGRWARWFLGLHWFRRLLQCHHLKYQCSFLRSVLYTRWGTRVLYRTGKESTFLSRLSTRIDRSNPNEDGPHQRWTEQNARNQGIKPIASKEVKIQNGLGLKSLVSKRKNLKMTREYTRRFPKGNAPWGGAAKIYFSLVGSISPSQTI